EVNHLRAHLAVDGVQRSLASCGGRRFNGGQARPRSAQRLACWIARLFTVTRGFSVGQTVRAEPTPQRKSPTFLLPPELHDNMCACSHVGAGRWRLLTREA